MGSVKTRVLVFFCAAAISCKSKAEDPLLRIRAEVIRKHQTILASEEFEGRGAGSEGGRRASAYLVEQVKALGFRPAGSDGTFFQPFGDGRRNVAAYWPGTQGNQYVVVGAHYDHLGRKGGTIYPGADDNASGTSTVLDLAEAVSTTHFLRGVVCLWFDGEENNLEGSRWWTGHPTLPISGCFAMLNCDMIGRNEAAKIFCGVEKDAQGEPRYPKWAAEVRKAEARFGMPFDWKEFDPYLQRSDHWPFMEKGVPALFFTGGLHADYHKEGDRIEKINFAKEELIGRILFSILSQVASRPDPLK